MLQGFVLDHIAGKSDALLAGESFFRMPVALMFSAAHVFHLGFMNFGDKFACAHFGKIHFCTSKGIGIWRVGCPMMANGSQEFTILE